MGHLEEAVVLGWSICPKRLWARGDWELLGLCGLVCAGLSLSDKAI